MKRVGLLAPLVAATAIPILAQENWNVLAVASSSPDLIEGAGGTLAKLALEGHQVYVAQFGNDEKASVGSGAAETRWANLAEARQACEYLGFRDTIHMAHKSGELSQVASTEMRQQLFALIRYLRPRKIFIPDPYVHYQDDWDIYWAGKMAEEAWGYSGAATFGTELARMGLRPYGVPEVYYYPVGRPYGTGEGGEKDARFIGVDVGPTLPAKLSALGMLRTRNRQRALVARAQLIKVGHDELDESGPRSFVQAYAEELARVIGARHGFAYGEEFNYVGRSRSLPPHVLEKAVRK